MITERTRLPHYSPWPRANSCLWRLRATLLLSLVLLLAEGCAWAPVTSGREGVASESGSIPAPADHASDDALDTAISRLTVWQIIEFGASEGAVTSVALTRRDGEPVHNMLVVATGTQEGGPQLLLQERLVPGSYRVRTAQFGCPDTGCPDPATVDVTDLAAESFVCETSLDLEPGATLVLTTRPGSEGSNRESDCLADLEAATP